MSACHVLLPVFFPFLPRDAVLSAVYAILSVCPSICLSVTHVYCIKTAERIIKILSQSDRTIILVFHHQGSLHKSEGVTPIWGAKYKGGSDFRPICGYISETVIDRGIVTMEDEYIKLCVLYQILPYSMTLSDPNLSFKSQYSLKVNISQTVHPIHSMFASRLGFSGSGDRMALESISHFVHSVTFFVFHATLQNMVRLN